MSPHFTYPMIFLMQLFKQRQFVFKNIFYTMSYCRNKFILNCVTIQDSVEIFLSSSVDVHSLNYNLNVIDQQLVFLLNVKSQTLIKNT